MRDTHRAFRIKYKYLLDVLLALIDGYAIINRVIVGIHVIEHIRDEHGFLALSRLGHGCLHQDVGEPEVVAFLGFTPHSAARNDPERAALARRTAPVNAVRTSMLRAVTAGGR